MKEVSGDVADYWPKACDKENNNGEIWFTKKYYVPSWVITKKIGFWELDVGHVL